MIIIDVEIENAILGRGESPLTGIRYCEGWKDFKGMGISCACTFDTESHLSRVWVEEFQTLTEYLKGKHTGGFNTRRFDIPLLEAHGVKIDGQTHYDMLESVWMALGLNPDKFVPSTHGGWSLDAICEASMGVKKSGNGALAPVWWQRGERGKVIDYCLRDVWLEASLLQYIVEYRKVTNGRQSVDMSDFLPKGK